MTACRIPLRRKDGSVRAYALVDPDVFARLGHLRWCLSSKGYVHRHAPKGQYPRKIWLHREVLCLGPRKSDPREGDHRYGDKLDNRRENLRIVTTAENAQNRVRQDPRNRSGYRGVSWHTRRQRWVAQVRVGGRVRQLGVFTDPEEAGRAAATFRAESMPFSAEAAAEG
jgi:hypothetical protein